MESSAKSADEVVEEIMRTHRSLPPRPGIEDVEGAKILIRNADSELQSRLESIAKQKKRKDVPEELFSVLIEMQKHLVQFHAMEQKREAIKLLDLENYHLLFDEMIQRASSCCGPSRKDNNNSQSITPTSNFTHPSSTTNSKPISSLYSHKEPVKVSELFTRDDSYVSKSKSVFNGDSIRAGVRSSDVLRPNIVDSTLKPVTISGEF